MSNQVLSLFDFLDKHKCKGANSTHTRIPDRDLNIYAGAYIINEEDKEDFKTVYCDKVFVNKHQEFLTEAQLPTAGPILIDLDFRYDVDIDERQHTEDHISDLVELYLEQLQKIVTLTDEEFPVFILEKPNVNTLENVTKDGIHIVIGIHLHHEAQMMLREYILEGIDYILSELPLKNDYESVIDKGIVTGKTNWQLYGSRKPGNEAYEVIQHWNMKYDAGDDEFEYTDMMDDTINHHEIFDLISARKSDNVRFELKDDVLERCKTADANMNTKKTRNRIKIRKYRAPTNQILPTTLESLKKAVKDNLQLATMNDDLYEVREVHEFAMALAEFRATEFDEWLKVGWTLHACDCELLFPTWMLFSAKSDKFDFQDIPKYWSMWSDEFNIKCCELTRGSIMWWCKQDNPIAYEKIKCNTVDYFINKTIEHEKPPDYDIAGILHRMYGDQYKCVSIKSNVWYEMVGGRWSDIDSGTTLRKKLSSQLALKYTLKAKELVERMTNMDSNPSPTESKSSGDDDDEMKKLQKLAGRTAGIGLDLRRTNNKNNIMKEAKEHFFDKLFLEKLDNNPYLLCFTNGIIDFEKKEFRMTKPDDYVSLCTNIEYIKMDEENVKHMSIKKEITEFMEQLFPDSLLNKYMWQHMAASLKGTNENQVFNIYTGTGRNGKSKLVDLVSMALGDYKATVPITLVTSRRTTIGGASPEIAQLKGIRYACMQEPSENMAINEGVMKELTGGDPLSGRALYCDTITFNPQFTLVVCTNHLFDIKSTDDGTWRRIRVCDFESKFLDKPYENEKDFPKNKYPYQFKCVKDIDSRFEAWAPYFISMLVEIAFETNGVVEDCPQVLAASQKYKMQQDYFAQFFEERIVPVEGGTIKRKDLQNEFIEWYTELYGGKVPKGKDLYDFMESKLGKCDRGRFKGHRLIHSFEQDLDVVPNNI
uniref:SF3 helicase domain-containing protein n=1 Tax=viral metagenome TaxID=1070528 RepID=A0A6C0ENJ3_9ZZZZ